MSTSSSETLLHNLSRRLIASISMARILKYSMSHLMLLHYVERISKMHEIHNS